MTLVQFPILISEVDYITYVHVMVCAREQDMTNAMIFQKQVTQLYDGNKKSKRDDRLLRVKNQKEKDRKILRIYIREDYMMEYEKRNTY